MSDDINDNKFWLLASASTYAFWDNPLDAEYDHDAPSKPASADAPAPSFAALTDDYAETMLRFAGAIESGVLEP